MSKDYNRFKTAIGRSGLSAPMRCLVERGYISTSDRVLDYGCGRGIDGKLLRGGGYVVNDYDKYNEEFNSAEQLDKKYDVITCHYVLNVIPCLEEHEALIEDLQRLSSNVYVSVRKDMKAIKDNWRYDEECLGYFTTRGTFQRFYDGRMINELFGDVKILKSNSSFILIKL